MKKIFLIFMFLLTQSIATDFNGHFLEAGKAYNINPSLLEAIAITESRKNPNAVNCANKNGSCDYGLMQINSIHLPMLQNNGIYKNDLFDPRINIFVGAWVLKNCMNKHGNTYKTLNCYNGKIKNNPYYTKVLKNYNDILIKNNKENIISSNENTDIDKQQNATTIKHKILVLGDSMAQGLEPQFKKMLKKYNAEIVTYYKLGSSSNFWSQKDLLKLIEKESPFFVFLALGTNELKSPNYEATKQIAKQLEMSNTSYKWIAPIDKEASKYNEYLTSLIGDKKVFILKEELELYDGIHPTPKSFKLWSEQVLLDTFAT